MPPIVIIGTGLAGYTVLREFRKRDQATPVTLICADDGHFYSKPNLSNALAAGKSPERLVNTPREKMAADLNAEILANTRVTAIDVSGRKVRCDDGETAYSKLVLALGADPIHHGLTGPGSERVYAVNDLQDYRVLRAALRPGSKVTILGGGLIGSEFANDLAISGHKVEVVHLGPWPLERLIPEPVGHALADALAAQGVIWHFGRTTKAIEPAGDGIALTLDDGSMIAKGHDFPRVTLVGVLGADASLVAADYRAPERLFAPLYQVAGRAGRADLPGVVLVQSRFPAHPLYQALVRHDFAGFAQAQLDERRAAGFPPAVHQAVLRAESAEMKDALAFLSRAAAQTPAAAEGVTVYDPVPMTLAKLAGKARAQVLLQSPSRPALHAFLRAWVEALYALRAGTVRWHLDVDPIEF